MKMSINSIVVFGDNIGIPQILKYIGNSQICGLVCAKIRLYQHEQNCSYSSYFS